MSVKKTIFIFFSFFVCSSQIAYGQSTLNVKPIQNQVLNCQEVLSRTNQMLDLHYSFTKFDEELSQRTFRKIFDKFDPYKIYFNSFDVNNFRSLKTQIGVKIQNKDCSFLFDIRNSFIQKVHERVEKVKKILAKSLNFSTPEYMETGKLNWARNEQELNDRLRRKIKYQYLTMKEANFKEEEIKTKIINNYIRFEKKSKDMTDDKIYSIFLNSFAESMDPHSSHMLPSDHDSFTIHISNKLEGIGATLLEKDGFIIIKALVAGGVAQKEGTLKVNDKLIAVDSGNGEGFQDAFDMEPDQVVELVRGQKGTEVKLVVLRKTPTGEVKLNINLIRDEINLQNENVQSTIFNYNGRKIGIIKIPTFYTDLKCKNKLFTQCHGVAYDTEQELKKLTHFGAEGILIDLRNDGGGDFPESIKLASLFIPHGVIVQTSDKNKYVNKQETVEGSWLYKGPLIVLINRYSASASEIFAGAIQDFERGIIVGDDRTYGKATVQIVQEISGTGGRKIDGAIKVTQNKFYRPAGSSNQKIGVHSDILVPSHLIAYDIGEDQLDYVLSRDTIAPAYGFKPLQNLIPLISKLKELSESRMSKDSQYKELFKKIDKIKNEKNKPLPLTAEFAKSIEERQYAEEQFNKKEEESERGSLVKQNDLQLIEALAITGDSIKFAHNPAQWVGER